MRTGMRFRCTAALMAVLLSGCDGFKDTLALSGAIQKQYGVPANVNLTNGSHLIITFQNLPQQTKGDSTDRAKFAAQVASFTKAHYAHADELDDVTIAFAQVKSAGPLTLTRTDAPYTFATKDIK